MDQDQEPLDLSNQENCPGNGNRVNSSEISPVLRTDCVLDGKLNGDDLMRKVQHLEEEQSPSDSEDEELDPVIFTACEYQRNLNTLGWTLESDNPRLKFKGMIDELVQQGNEKPHLYGRTDNEKIENCLEKSDHEESESGEDSETDQESETDLESASESPTPGSSGVKSEKFSDSEWETDEDEEEEEDDEEMPWMFENVQEPAIRLIDPSEDKENQGRDTGSPDIFRPFLEADGGELENFWDSDSDSEFDLEAKIEKAFDNDILNQRIEWPEKLKDHPILSTNPNPTIYEADILQMCVEFSERQERKRRAELKRKHQEMRYHDSMVRTNRKKKNASGEYTTRRVKNTAAARKSRAKIKTSESQLQREALKSFVEVETALVQEAKLELYCNQLLKMLGKPEIDWDTLMTVEKVHKWNKMRS